MITWIQLQAFILYVERYVAERVKEERDAELHGLEADAARAAHEPDRLIPAREAARLLCVSESTLYAKADAYPFTRRGPGGVRFSRRGVLAWIAGAASSTPESAA